MSPTPSPSPAPSPHDSAASSRDSGKGSDGFGVTDPGPEFDPDDIPPEAPPPPGDEPAVDLEWREDQVRAILTAQGGMTHALLGGEARIGPEAWLHTQADLAAIAPPLTRILNRFPATQAAAAGGDFFALGIGAFGYGTRSTLQMRQYRTWLAEHPDQPIPGAAPADPPAEPVVFPSDDERDPRLPIQPDPV